MDWLDYREKLGIGFSDKEKGKYFLTKINNVLDNPSDRLRLQIDEGEYFKFCNMTGIARRSGQLYGEGYNILVGILGRITKLEDYLAYYIAFVNCQKDNNNKMFTKEQYINLVCNMLTESHILFDVVRDKEGYFVFPKGAKVLDDALVSQPLDWLRAYPAAEKTFAKALRSYAGLTDSNASDVADLFRKALETFFQEFFGTDKTLENCKAIYGGYLKEQGVPKEIVSNFETLLQMYTTYMNAYAKHHDKAGKNALEYLMYQTGNIIRLLITLKQEESGNAH